MDNLVPSKTLIDPFGRTVDYIRVSVTDRCDFRCVYCMAEHMTFLPKAELLSLEELEQVVAILWLLVHVNPVNRW